MTTHPMDGYGMRRVVGLDLSLRSTGVSDGQSVHAYQTTDADSIEDRLNRLTYLCLGFVQSPSQWNWWEVDTLADLVVIEDSAYGARGPGHEELAALRYQLRCVLRRYRVPFAMVKPTQLKKYTTGNGRSGKPGMVAAIRDRHGVDLSRYKVKDGRYDMADAYALAAMGYAHLGQPLRTDPGFQPVDVPSLKVLNTRVSVPAQTPLSVASPLR